MDPAAPVWWASAGRDPRCKPQCRPPSHQKSSTSSSTIYATNRQRLKHVASSPNPGFIGHGSTSSLASNSTPRNPTSSCGRRRSRTLPPLPLIIRALSPFMAFRSSPLRIQMWMVGSAPFAALCACTWSASAGMIIKFPSPNSTDYRPSSDHSV